jgi:hypothetical protein
MSGKDLLQGPVLKTSLVASRSVDKGNLQIGGRNVLLRKRGDIP